MCKGSLSYCLCFEYFSQFKIDSETYTYLAAVLKMVMYQNRSSLKFGNYFGQNRIKLDLIEILFVIDWLISMFFIYFNHFKKKVIINSS